MNDRRYFSFTAGASALVLHLAVSGCCSIGSSRPLAGLIKHPAYCGGELSDAQLRNFLQIVRSGFSTGDFHDATSSRLLGPRPTLKDWKVIASSIEDGRLESVGWRGCILANGKAAFQSGPQEPLVLYSFDSSRHW